LRANRNSSKYFRFKVKREQNSAVSVHAVNTTEKTLYVTFPTVTERHSQASQVMGRLVIAVADRPTHTHGSRKPKGEHVAHEPEACTLATLQRCPTRAHNPDACSPRLQESMASSSNPSVPDEMDQLVKRKKYRRNTLGFWSKECRKYESKYFRFRTKRVGWAKSQPAIPRSTCARPT
jgi:hypothetical protein